LLAGTLTLPEAAITVGAQENPVTTAMDRRRVKNPVEIIVGVRFSILVLMKMVDVKRKASFAKLSIVTGADNGIFAFRMAVE
jgi:hypothetical protein